MTGKVSANINNIDIDGADLHTYVATDEGRSYTGRANKALIQKKIQNWKLFYSH